MSAADTLREAAALMRARAGAATEGPWTAEPMGSEGFSVFAPNGSRAPMRGRARVATCTWEDWDEVDAASAHIAGMDPTVALAVADWLDAVYYLDLDGESPGTTHAEWTAALAVARAYLRLDADA